MIKTLKNLLKQDKERYSVPRKVQDVIPIQRIWKDGIFQVGNRFSKTYKFTDINYLVASREDKESMFLAYSELLNSLDSGATTKITINNRRLNKANFEQSILMPMRGDSRDVYRREYNQMLLDKVTGANGIMQEKYISIVADNIDSTDYQEEKRICSLVSYSYTFNLIDGNFREIDIEINPWLLWEIRHYFLEDGGEEFPDSREIRVRIEGVQ